MICQGGGTANRAFAAFRRSRDSILRDTSPHRLARPWMTRQPAFLIFVPRKFQPGHHGPDTDQSSFGHAGIAHDRVRSADWWRFARPAFRYPCLSDSRCPAQRQTSPKRQSWIWRTVASVKTSGDFGHRSSHVGPAMMFSPSISIRSPWIATFRDHLGPATQPLGLLFHSHAC